MSSYDRLVDSLLGLKDWNKVVASAKDIIQSGSSDPEEELSKRISFLDQLEVKRAIEQAREELEEE